MKKIYTTIATFCLSIGVALCQQSPVINQNNFKINYNSELTNIANNAGVVIPSRGPNQIWDYSSLVYNSDVTFDYKMPDKTIYGNATFIATNLTDVLSSNAVLPYEEGRYVDSSGYYIGASYYDEQRLDISATTGASGDSLIIPEQYNVMEKPLYLIKFPCAYGDSFSVNTSRILDMRITVSGEGINDAPVKRVHYINQWSSVIGWGKLTLPYNAGKSNAVDVLLIQKSLTVIDSMLLNGQPAPAQLLQGFNIVQGAKATYGSYFFVRDQNKNPLLQITTTANFKTIKSVLYDANTLYALNANNTAQSSLSLYPNPARHSFTLNMPSEENNSIMLINQQGQEVYHQQKVSGSNIQIATDQLAQGIYIVKVNSTSGKVYTSKIVIE
jgi:hypothetical protein